MYKHFGVNYSVAVTEAIVSGTDAYVFRPDNDSAEMGLKLFGMTYLHIDLTGIVSGLEAIACMIRRVPFVTMYDVLRP